MSGARGAQVEAEAQKLRFFDRIKGRVFQHPASINFNCGRFESGWLVYTDLIETSKVGSALPSARRTQKVETAMTVINR